MRTLTKILLASTAALTITAGSAMAQEDESTNILGGALDSVESTVDNTVDAVDNTVSDTVDNTVGDVTGNSGDADVSDTVGDVTGNSGDTDTAIGDVGNFDDLLNDLNAGNTEVTDLSDISEVQVVDVADVANFDADAFNDALNGNASDISALQDSINGNSALENLLSSNNIDVSDVVGLNNSQDGTLIVYTND